MITICIHPFEKEINQNKLTMLPQYPDVSLNILKIRLKTAGCFKIQTGCKITVILKRQTGRLQREISIELWLENIESKFTTMIRVVGFQYNLMTFKSVIYKCLDFIREYGI